MKQSVSMELRGCLAVAITLVVTTSFPAELFGQQSNGQPFPPIVQAPQTIPNVLPPIVSVDQALPQNNSNMLQPLGQIPKAIVPGGQALSVTAPQVGLPDAAVTAHARKILTPNLLTPNLLSPVPQAQDSNQYGIVNPSAVSLQPNSNAPSSYTVDQMPIADPMVQRPALFLPDPQSLETQPSETQQSETPDAGFPNMVSTAGVPIYPQGSGIRRQPSKVQNSSFIQGSGTRNVPPIVNPNVVPQGRSTPPTLVIPNANQPPPIISGDSIQQTPQSVVTPEFTQDPVPELDIVPQIEDPPGYSSPAASTPGTNDYFDNSQQQQAGVDSCGCTSCGEGGCYDPDVVQSQFSCSGSVSGAGYYMMAEALIWSRNDGEIAASNFFGLDDFSYEGGFRFTLGYRQNSVYGREITYFGTGEVNDRRELTDQFNRLGSVFVSGGGFAGFETSSFFNANRQIQSKNSKIHSLEYNRVKWGQDILKTHWGVRYIYMGDEFNYFSDNGSTQGRFDMHSINNLFGGQVGWELFYDVGYRASISFWNKWAAYVNLANVDTVLNNAGFIFLDKNEDVSGVASSIELGMLIHYQLNPQVRLRTGYDFLWMWGIYTVNNNFPRVNQADPRTLITPPPELVSPATGSLLNTNNEAVLWNGFSIGVEIFR